ncbi:restriction endonuclease [Chloroflexota bacterium]
MEDAVIRGTYSQNSVRARIEAFFLDNVGKVAIRDQIMEVAKDPKTGKTPENWHQRLSELRTDYGYTILTWRNRGDLKISEYLMPTTEKRQIVGKRIRPDSKIWQSVLKTANYRCVWDEDGVRCNLRDGEIDPVGGGTVRLSPDHREPHSVNPIADPNDPQEWRPLCGRHQVMKKNYWDDRTGWLNVYAIVQASSESEKREVFKFLKAYFGEK